MVVAILLLLSTASVGVAFHTVEGAALTVSFSFTPLQPAKTDVVTFTGIASGGVAPYVFAWNFGDGSTASGNTVAHAYQSAGVFTVTVTVTDSSSNTGSQTQMIVVTNNHAFSFGIAGDFGIVSPGYPASSSFYPVRQSLLRLGNSSSLEFFIADGNLAHGFYYRNEAAWCTEFKAHFNNIVLVAGESDTGWTDGAYDDIFISQTSNTTSIYNSSVDSTVFNGFGGGELLPGPTSGVSKITTDNKLRYWDSNGNGHYDAGESIVYDYDNVRRTGVYYPVMAGPIPPQGAVLSNDPHIKYYSRTGGTSYARPPTNNDFEQYVASCGFPALLGAWHGSGVNCSNYLPGQTGYVFPSCYGREYYFDVGTPTPQLRVVVVSPSVQNVTGHMTTYGTDYWFYQKGDQHYNWVNATINAAYAAGIPETMVVSFEECLTSTLEECAGGYHHQSPFDSSGTKFEADLFDLLLDSLVPQGKRSTYLVNSDDKGYARFYPLATHPTSYPPGVTGDSLGCAWNSTQGLHGFILTKYKYDEGDTFADPSNQSCFANPVTPGQPYTPWAGFVGDGITTIMSGAFGASLQSTQAPGEIPVKDLDGSGVYKFGDPFIGGFEPVPGTLLTGNQATNSHIGFIDPNGNGQWDPGETLFRDANSSDGCSATIDCNGYYDPGETVISGPVPNVRMRATFNDTDVKIIDMNGNGKWDTSPGYAHATLENVYMATSMGNNTPCSTRYATTCPGHGWVSYSFNAYGNQTNIDTDFCIDGETPRSNFASCVSPGVYTDKYVLINSNVPIERGFTSSATLLGVNASIAGSFVGLGATTWTVWISATNTTNGQTLVAHSSAYLTLSPDNNAYLVTYTFNATSASNSAGSTMTIECSYDYNANSASCSLQTPGGSVGGVTVPIDLLSLVAVVAAGPVGFAIILSTVAYLRRRRGGKNDSVRTSAGMNSRYVKPSLSGVLISFG